MDLGHSLNRVHGGAYTRYQGSMGLRSGAHEQGQCSMKYFLNTS